MSEPQPKGKTYRYKIALIGNEGTGKTSLIEKYMQDKFASDYRPTLGTNILSKTFHLKGLSSPDSNDAVVLTIWDIAGQDRYEPMRHMYFQGSAGIIMVYDITRTPTFSAISEKWVLDYKNYADKNPVVILVGNKSDLTDQLKISSEEGQSAANGMKAAQFLETSAKNGENVSQLFTTMITELLRNHGLLGEGQNKFTFV